MSQKVLIINSDLMNTAQVSNSLREAGFILYHTSDPNKGLEIIKKENPIIIILDLDFTKFQAFDFCRTLRIENENWTPLILMSEQDEEFDLVLGLELGADDYIRKPVRPKELIARVKSILRRQTIVWPKQKNSISINTHHEDILVNGDLTISPSNYLVYVKDKNIGLTMKEFKLILYLCKNKGKPVSRDELLAVVNDEEVLVDPRVIDVFISRIREKIEPHRHKPLFIRTIRGIGYMMIEQNSHMVKAPVITS